MRRAVGFFAFLLMAFALPAQQPTDSGEEAVAARYVAYALKATEEGRWRDAETILTRASDFAGVSSDLSYYLALSRRKLGRPIGSVLDAVNRSLESGRWSIRSADDARLLAAECYLDVCAYDEALSVLEEGAADADSVFLALRALRGSGDTARFRQRLREALASFPRDARFLRLVFETAGPGPADDADERLVALALERVPFLLESDRFLAVCAAPYVRDLESRRRFVAAYRAVPPVSEKSIPIALELGLLRDRDAVEELFSLSSIDAALLSDTYARLRDQDARSSFDRKAARFTGTLSVDSNADDRPEALVDYVEGETAAFSYDADQDGLLEWKIFFSDGLPSRASIVLSVEKTAGDLTVPARPVADSERVRADLKWERYPYVESITVGSSTFRFSPVGFPFAPVRLIPLYPESSVFLPKIDFVAPRLTERSLYSSVSVLERPGSLMAGSTERCEYSAGTILRSTETVRGATLAATQYRDGFPVVRRMDLDLDGRIETIARFKQNTFEIGSTETDFDGDGVFEKDEHK